MRFCFCVILIVFSKLVLGQKPIVVSDSFHWAELSTQLVVAEDKSKSLSLEKALALTYTPVEQKVPNFGFSNSSYWFKGTVINNSSQWQSPVIEVANPNLDAVNLYVFSKKTGRHKKNMGDLVPFAARGNKNKYYHFNLQLLPHDTLQFVLNVQNSGEQFHVPMQIGTAAYFQESESNEQLIFGVYFGFILFVLLLNVFFYYVLKDKAALLYIGYLAALLFLQLSLTGFGFKYFWPNSVFLANHANPIFASISGFFLLVFAQNFLNIKGYLPKLNKWVNAVKYYLLLVIITSWIDINEVYLFSVLSINGLVVICIFVFIPTAIYILKQNFKPARFFITAFIVLIISVLLFVLKNAGVLPSNAITNYGLQIGSALEVLLLTLAVIDKFNEFRIDSINRLQEVNELKTRANVELEIKVEERTKQVNEQNALLEGQNNEIKSSIRYAKRIQDSLLPAEEILNELFDENYFTYYKPKDIVSGDFYWAAPVTTSGDNPHRLSLAAVVDCTGHGVPGAFLSIVASNFLKQSLTEKSVNNTAEALDFLNEKVIATLNQTSKTETIVRDGMDVSLIAIDYSANKLYYSGANNSVYIYRKTDDKPELTVLEPTKQAIGSVADHVKSYELKTVNIQAGDTIYLFSDGYADQFGGEKDKKLNYKRFKEILANASEMPMNLQKNYLDTCFEAWRGTTEQTDDVCVMGIKI
ncbi:MAG: SpoIIE family protein phosphatase [Bacteroidetes bacterium]|nr:SpoIIE family protein phosphatase [Bacteroidota bacterium]